MLSSAEIKEIRASFDYFDFSVEFHQNRKIRRINILSMDQVFMDEEISIRKAIHHKTLIRCFIDVGEDHIDDFVSYGSLSLTYEPKLKKCIIGLIWIEPEYRGKGLATYFLDQITTAADDLDLVLSLFALPYVGNANEPKEKDFQKLKDFYEQFGFKESSQVRGTGFDYTMTRIPDLKLYSENNRRQRQS